MVWCCYERYNAKAKLAVITHEVTEACNYPVVVLEVGGGYPMGASPAGNHGNRAPKAAGGTWWDAPRPVLAGRPTWGL